MGFESEKREFRALLDSLPFDTPLTHPAVEALLSHHKSWKPGYTVHKERQYTHHHNLVVTDAEHNRAIIGWNSALRRKLGLRPLSKRSTQADAARWEIDDQIQEFRRGRYGEVDHVIQFKDMWRSFLTTEGLTTSDVQVEKPDLAQIRTQFKDRALAARWQAYHKEHAVLQLLTPEQHLEITKQRFGFF